MAAVPSKASAPAGPAEDSLYSLFLFPAIKLLKREKKIDSAPLHPQLIFHHSNLIS